MNGDDRPKGHDTDSEHECCRCGWELPITAFAFKFQQLPAAGAEVKGVYVALRCPQCDQPHAFFGAEPASIAAFESMTTKRVIPS
jgi:hypothetical protein